MKKQVQVEKAYCDFCAAASEAKFDAWQTCFRCGKDVCFNCRVQYPREMYIQSTDDLVACPDCAAIIENDPSIIGPLAAIMDLKKEGDAWSESFRKRVKEAEAATRNFTPVKKLLVLLLLLLLPMVATAQELTLRIDCDQMEILKEHGRWYCQPMTGVATVTYPDAKVVKSKKLAKAATTNVGIPVTPVEGVFRKSVSPCVLSGILEDGAELTMRLPREPVLLKGFERVGIRYRPVMVAVRIECPFTLVKKSGETWAGVGIFEDCDAHWTSRRSKMADSTILYGTAKKVK